MASLPEMPQGKELEDYVAAFLHCGRYFVEKSIIEREQKDILELDMVATAYVDGLPRRLLFEVKSGSWGFSDLFKLLGWKTYLSPDKVDDAYFVITGPVTNTPIDFFKEKFEELGIFLVAASHHTQIESALLDAGLVGNQFSQSDHQAWRFYLWLETKMLDVVARTRRTHPDRQGPDDVYQYQELIKNGIVLTAARLGITRPVQQKTPFPCDRT